MVAAIKEAAHIFNDATDSFWKLLMIGHKIQYKANKSNLAETMHIVDAVNWGKKWSKQREFSEILVINEIR